jgi:hypothetical protein
MPWPVGKTGVNALLAHAATTVQAILPTLRITAPESE